MSVFMADGASCEHAVFTYERLALVIPSHLLLQNVLPLPSCDWDSTLAFFYSQLEAVIHALSEKQSGVQGNYQKDSSRQLCQPQVVSRGEQLPDKTAGELLLATGPVDPDRSATM